MDIHQLLSRQARIRARCRAARISGRLLLYGPIALALALLCERAGLRVPCVDLGGVGEGPLAAFLGVARGLAEALRLLALLLALTLVARVAGGQFLRPSVRRTAALLDRALGTDSYAAALEGTGPLAPLAARRALERGDAPDVICPPPFPRGVRLLRLAGFALVILIAILPGRAPGEAGQAPGAGPPRGGERLFPLHLELVGEQRRYPPGHPVPVQVIGEAQAAPRTDLDLPVSIRIDSGEPIETSARLFLPAGAPGQDSVQFDLRRLAAGLGPGEHVAVAHAGEATSNLYRFRIEPPSDGQGGASRPPPSVAPQPKPPPRGRRNNPPDVKPRFVEPLIREGQRVRKRARVPIEVPEGGAPVEKPLKEAWPVLQRRKEAALKRPGLSPAARKLVREYFEKLRPKPK